MFFSFSAKFLYFQNFLLTTKEHPAFITTVWRQCALINCGTVETRGENLKRCLLVDERVGHDAQLLNLSALLLGQVLHGLLGVKAGPAGAVAVNLPLVLPRL